MCKIQKLSLYGDCAIHSAKKNDQEGNQKHIIKLLWPNISYIRAGVPEGMKCCEISVGMRRLCQHNLGHNRYVWESGIMLAFRGDYKASTVGKFTDCTISLKKSRYSNRAVTEYYLP